MWAVRHVVKKGDEILSNGTEKLENDEAMAVAEAKRLAGRHQYHDRDEAQASYWARDDGAPGVLHTYWIEPAAQSD